MWATFFVGFFLVFLPRAVLEAGGVATTRSLGAAQLLGIGIGAIGAALALWCIVTFATRGKGTPAPFDPPRRLVVQGPYRYLRNPMYLGSGLSLAGAALYYGAPGLWLYLGGYLLVLHFFVLLYEEPALRGAFGADYEAYCARVSRWLPRRSHD